MDTESPIRVFISYAHEDEDHKDALEERLKAIARALPVVAWSDRLLLAGARWADEIAARLSSADIVCLLISPAFLASDYCWVTEMPLALAKCEQRGSVVVPIVVEETPSWTTYEIGSKQALPTSGKPVSNWRPRTKAWSAVERGLHELLKRLIAARAVQDHAPAAELVRASVLADLDVKQGLRAASDLVGRLAGVTKLRGTALFDAARFSVEYYLLAVDKLTAARLHELTSEPPGGELASFREALERSVHRDAFKAVAIGVNGLFFSRIREREEHWLRYFEALVAAGYEALDLESLSKVHVHGGHLAPQHLVAGLLSRFDDDWRPVLRAYPETPPDRLVAFESLQASQWSCWLLWGPSIPLCSCEEWQGTYAFQYGFGDENNSLPVLECRTPRQPDALGACLSSPDSSTRAQLVSLSGRLRWGPWFLQADAPQESAGEPESRSDERDPPSPALRPSGHEGSKRQAARAQRSLFEDSRHERTQHSDGLILQLEKVERLPRNGRNYFTAYLWLMFWLATPGQNGLPSRLRRQQFPAWPGRAGSWQAVDAAQLWLDLLPVFVHTNIGDPSAFEFQKAALVDSGLQLLRQIWNRRAELFDEADVASGIQFHLASASDYTGCGCAVRYPARDPLPELLRQRLVALQASEPAFASSVQLPPKDETENTRYPPLRAYYSSCHLPDLIAGYYKHVKGHGTRSRAPTTT
jgi:hypothetical protein